MPNTYNLRNSQKFDVEIMEEVCDEMIESSSSSDGLSLMNSDLCEKIVDKFGARLREEIGAIVDSLKIDLLSELVKRDKRIADIESEVIFLRDAVAVNNVKISKLEIQVAEMSLDIATLIHAPRPQSSAHDAPLLPTLDTVIAGDSIVKHIDVKALDGVNSLVCLPGARAHKVHLAVTKLAQKANIKNLVLHMGTNNIPHQSPMQICNELADTLKRVQLELPNTAIHFSAILPKVNICLNRGINFINNFIFDLCEDLGIGFVEHSSFCQDGQMNKKYYAPTEWREGRAIHPSHEGALLLQTNIKLHLMK
jgi:hypothetical protein